MLSSAQGRTSDQLRAEEEAEPSWGPCLTTQSGPMAGERKRGTPAPEAKVPSPPGSARDPSPSGGPLGGRDRAPSGKCPSVKVKFKGIIKTRNYNY